MAGPIAVIPVLCIALRGTCPAANKQQGHSCLWKAVIIPRASPLLSLSSPAGSTGSCGSCSTSLTNETMGKGPQAAMQCLMPKHTTSQQPSNVTSSTAGRPQHGETSTFQFPQHCLLKSTHNGQHHGALSNNWKAPKCLHFSIPRRQKRTLHRHRREESRSLGNLLHSNLSQDKHCRGWRKFFFVLTSVQKSIACNCACGHAGLGSKSRVHLWLLAPAQRGGWKSSNVNSNSGCPNKPSLALTEAYQKADWRSCLRNRGTACWKPSDKEYFYPSITKEAQEDATESNSALFLESNMTNAWDKIYLGPPSTITKIPGPRRTRDREIFRGGLSPQLHCLCNHVSGVHYCPSQGQGTKLDGPQWHKISNISRS